VTSVLVISHRDLVETSNRFEAALFRGLTKHVDLHFADWDDGLASPSISTYARLAGRDLREFEACIFHVRFSRRMAAEPLEWDEFGGLRIWLEPDAYASFDSNNLEYGLYPQVYRRDRFNAMVSTGREITDRLRSQNVDAFWLPKAYDHEVFFNRGETRSGVCTFGTRWPSRAALLHHLARSGVEVVDVSGPYISLNTRLNKFGGALVCNMLGTIPLNRPGKLGRPGRLLNRRFPRFVKVTHGLEPMAKTFEVAGAGCAPIVDAMDELAELGFRSGQTCLIYRDFKEAEEIVRSCGDDELHDIGSRAHLMARERHTWAHRASQLSNLIERLLKGLM
jgi:hypothetical protein